MSLTRMAFKHNGSETHYLTFLFEHSCSGLYIFLFPILVIFLTSSVLYLFISCSSEGFVCISLSIYSPSTLLCMWSPYNFFSFHTGHVCSHSHNPTHYRFKMLLPLCFFSFLLASSHFPSQPYPSPHMNTAALHSSELP